jgi:cysteinyl-tRNA synthetase
VIIYNTLSRKKEEFIPKDPPRVTMYVCGPTVYDYFHIGNARSFIMADMIRRYLVYKGYDVKFVMNITDIDDRIIEKSIKSEIPASQVSAKFTEAFLADIKKLNVREATIYPKATEHLESILRLIEKIEDNGYAYNQEGNVYFDVSRFEGYGKLSGKKLDQLEAGARVEVSEEKKNPLDFALWKKAKEGEPYWKSRWGIGRPGWHIECSAMSMQHLGKTIDIHAGGSDLIFPHHENEIAQSEAANSDEFVKYWIHFGFLNIDNEKMSKSLGNFFTAREILEHYSAEVIRFLFCQTHYSGPLNFSNLLLESAKKGHEKLENTALMILEQLKTAEDASPGVDFDFEKYYKEFETAMDNDFNSPVALSVIFDFSREINQMLSKGSIQDKAFLEGAKEFLIKTAGEVLGILDIESLLKDRFRVEEADIYKVAGLLIDLRQREKDEKNYARADKIRDELLELGISVEDSKSGPRIKIGDMTANIETKLLDLISALRNEYKKEKRYDLSDMIRGELNELGFELSDGKSGTMIKRKS